jgi:S-DNA-T family DNA segregation ATPase FtsK/SpoIIIE
MDRIEPSGGKLPVGLPDPWGGLPEHLLQWKPGVRSICDPIPLGLCEDGTLATLPLWTSSGAKRPFIVGASGSGKSNTLNVTTAGVVSAIDTVLWVIEVSKAGEPVVPWLSCVDWLAITISEAVCVLRAALAIINVRALHRSRLAACGKGPASLRPSAKQPLLCVKIDEAAGLFGIMSGKWAEMAAEATFLAREIARLGRSVGVSLEIATQRPTLESLGGDGLLRSQLAPNLCLAMNRPSDLRFALPGANHDMLDLDLFTVEGVVMMQDGATASPLPIRTYALYEPSWCYRLSKLYEAYRPRLEPEAIQAAGAAYARRSTDPLGVLDQPAPTLNVSEPTQTATSKGPRGNADTDPTNGDYATAEHSQQAASTALATVRRIAAERLTEVPKIAMTDLARMHTPGPVPEEPGDVDRRAAAKTALVDAPAEGMSASDVGRHAAAAGVEISRAHVYRVLDQLIVAGEAHRTEASPRGRKRQWRYHPGPVPTARESAA